MSSAQKKIRGGVEIVLLLLAILLAGLLLKSAVDHYYRAAYPIHYREIVMRESEKNGVPPSLVYAVIRTESDFDPLAESEFPARGLMQLTRDTYDWVGGRLGKPQESLDYDHLFDEETNILFGAALLRILLEEFGTVENTLCAYHAGRSRAKEWLENPAYSQDGKQIDHIPSAVTSRYVRKVLKAQGRYQQLYGID